MYVLILNMACVCVMCLWAHTHACVLVLRVVHMQCVEHRCQPFGSESVRRVLLGKETDVSLAQRSRARVFADALAFACGLLRLPFAVHRVDRNSTHLQETHHHVQDVPVRRARSTLGYVCIQHLFLHNPDSSEAIERELKTISRNLFNP